MSLRSTHKTNETLETSGVRIPVDINAHNGQPVYVTLSRMGRTNKRYTKRLEDVMRPHQAALANDALDPDLARRLLQGVFVETVLIGWENLPKSELTGDDTDTEELPFNKDNALALFAELPGLFDDWRDRAGKAATFREAVLDMNAKN